MLTPQHVAVQIVQLPSMEQCKKEKAAAAAQLILKQARQAVLNNAPTPKCSESGLVAPKPINPNRLSPYDENGEVLAGFVTDARLKQVR
jgi:hypothetical protein